MGITEELRWTAAKLMNIGKFAVDSAVSEVYTIVKGKLKGEEPHSEKKNLVVVAEEMQAKLEKLQQEKNNIQQQQQSKMSTLITQEKEHLKKHLFDEPEPLKSRVPEVTGRRKIFIRSRL